VSPDFPNLRIFYAIAMITPQLELQPTILLQPASSPNSTPVRDGSTRHAAFSPICGTPFLMATSKETSSLRDLGDDDLRALAADTLSTMRNRGLSPPEVPILRFNVSGSSASPNQRHTDVGSVALTPSVCSKPLPDIYANARFEQIACAGLPVKFDGSPEQLIPTLDLIHIRRINEVWHSATYVKKNNVVIDLIHQFSKVTLADIQNQAKVLWTAPDVELLRHTHGTATYNARLFGVFLLNSLTPDFAALIFSRIDQTYSMDGPLLFITMCQHIHRNHLAFVESIKNKIRLSTLAEHKNDVPAYLQFLQRNLRVITSTGDADTLHNDLLPHIFMQLRSTTIPIFQQKVLEWQQNYMENKLQTSPFKLVKMADDECQILKHSLQWVETIDPSVVVMQAVFQATTQGNTDLFQSIAANLSALTKMQQPYNKSPRVDDDSHSGRRFHFDTPEWVYDAPKDLSQRKVYQGRTWYFCTKCGRDGKWVCTHSDATHRPREEYLRDRRDRGRSSRESSRERGGRMRDEVRSRSRSPPRSSGKDNTYMHDRSRAVRFQPTPPASPKAKLSLLESIHAFADDSE
jgi:hypothetical protein